MSDAVGPHVVMLVRNPYTHDTRVEKEAASFLRAGYRVTVVADAEGKLPEREERLGTNVVRVRRQGPRIPGVSFLLHQWRLARRLLRLRPSVLHAHDSNALVPVALAARRARVPFVYDAHDLWLHRPRRQRPWLYHAAQNAYFTVVEYLCVPRAAAVMTVSPPIVRHLQRRYCLPRVELVPNYPEHGPEPVMRDLRGFPQLANVPPDAGIVLYLGGLMGGRGLEYLVQAMVHVLDGHLVLLGEGHLASALQAEARAAGVSGRVHLVPPVPPEEVVAYARSSQVGVSPIVPSCLNYRYSLPNKLFQYMAAGIPVVASDFPQVREVIVGSQAGLVVDTSRPSAIASALRQVLADPARAREMGAAGRRAVEERFNWDSSAATLLDTYERIVRGWAE